MIEVGEMTDDAVAALCTRVPRTATELYLQLTGVPFEEFGTRRHRRDRRLLARRLEFLSRKGVVNRAVATDSPQFIVFWRDAVDTDGPGADQPVSAGSGAEARRSHARGVDQ